MNAPALHQNHSWLPKSREGQLHPEFIATARDIACGAELCIQIINSDRMDRIAGSPTLFTVQQVENLTLLAAGALRMLAGQAHELIDSMNEDPVRAGGTA